jgi:hypothetical protein
MKFETEFDPLDLAPKPDVDLYLRQVAKFNGNPLFAGAVGKYANVVLHDDSPGDTPSWLAKLLMTGEGAPIQIIDQEAVVPEEAVTWKNVREILERKK